MSERQNQSTTQSTLQSKRGFVLGLWGVRYQVNDVGRSADFYTQKLGFKLDQRICPPLPKSRTEI